MLSFYLSMIETEEDKSKFQLLYERYKDLCFYIVGQEVDNNQDVEDIVSQTFIKIIEYLDKIEKPVSPKTKNTVALIARHTVADFFRKKERKKVVLLEDEGLDPASDMNVEHIVESGDVADAMASLSPKYRDLLLLKYDSGFKDEEIAALYHMTVSNVRRTILRAKEKLETLLKRLEVNV